MNEVNFFVMHEQMDRQIDECDSQNSDIDMYVAKATYSEVALVWIHLHFASMVIWVNAYANDAEKIKNQAIRTPLDGDLAIYFSPCMDVSPANAVRFSSNFILEVLNVTFWSYFSC